MIIFKNKGVIDLRAFKIFGISAKKENAIGFFGTGLKYAIAVCAREGVELSLYSGLEKITFTKKEIAFGGKSFDVICANGEELGFTTELGKTWSLWQAFREIYCNCTDEGGSIYKDSVVKCEADETVITVSGPEFEDIFENVGLFILQDKPDVETQYADIRFRPSHSAFYKGVRVKDDMGHCMFTYNIKEKIDLTEDRTAKYAFQIDRSVCKAVVKLNDPSLVERIVCANSDTYEGKLSYDISEAPSKAFIDVCQRLAEDQSVEVNKSAVQYADKWVNINSEPQEYRPSDLEVRMFQRAQELLTLSGYNIGRYPVKFVRTLGTGVYAEARTGVMYISKECFAKGTKLLAHALLEETFHLEHGYEDETRAFQTFLFDNILTLVERLNQEAF